MIKALIIDDEPSAIETLTFMIQRYVPEISDLQSTRDPNKGVELLQSLSPQLLFLDVQMPGLNGFDVLKKVNRFSFEVIFTTAFNQYAIEAIRFSALDFLLKPIDADELKSAIRRFLEKRASEEERQKLFENLKFNLTAEQSDFKIAITTTKGTFFYPIRNIIRLEGDGNYTRLFFDNDKPLLASRTLKDFEEILSMHGFLRVHRSHLVNKDFVEAVLFDGYIEMSDKSKIEISRRRKEIVMQELKKA
ncbi:MAG TPA: LytTR family DNA-binding domain-containing protein [Saprospiraceae bacterium]|nr:LytTR family DNA-binding domain-containing protein [Saprospiraceae bacterium]